MIRHENAAVTLDDPGVRLGRPLDGSGPRMSPSTRAISS